MTKIAPRVQLLRPTSLPSLCVLTLWCVAGAARGQYPELPAFLKPPQRTLPSEPQAGEPEPAPAPEQPAPEHASPDRSGELMSKSGAPELEVAQRSWVIALAAYRDQGHEQRAREALAEFQRLLPDAYVLPRGSASLIAYGRYDALDDPRAGADLARIRAIESGGQRPLAGALLAPPDVGAMPGSRPEWSLTTARRALPGEKIPVYSLQVGVYARLDQQHPTPAELAEFRAAAENAVATLRREGERAYYYHGPVMSMVCVGAFDDTDLPATGDARTGRNERGESPRLSDLRRRFPHNLVNGAGLRVKTRGQEGRLQESFLVSIPAN